MQQQLTCTQVGALLTYYLEEKLNDQLKTYVEYHLSVCPNCKEKYIKLKKMISNLNEITDQIKPEFFDDESPHFTRQYQEFKANLSAYVDNELDDEENIRIKKIAISNPLARRDLEDIYTFKKLLHSSFDKTRHEAREDFSRTILNKVYTLNEKNRLDPFYILMTIFAFIIAAILLGVVNIVMT